MRTVYVCGLLFTREEEVVALVRKTHPPRQAGLLNGVGGHVRDGERTLPAMVRKFREEAGLRVKGWELYCVQTLPDARVYHYRASVPRTPRTRLHKRPTGQEQANWYLVAEVPERGDAVPDLHWLVAMAHARCRGDWPYGVSLPGSRRG